MLGRQSAVHILLELVQQWSSESVSNESSSDLPCVYWRLQGQRDDRQLLFRQSVVQKQWSMIIFQILILSYLLSTPILTHPLSKRSGDTSLRSLQGWSACSLWQAYTSASVILINSLPTDGSPWGIFKVHSLFSALSFHLSLHPSSCKAHKCIFAWK